jgi:hypothetical protein
MRIELLYFDGCPDDFGLKYRLYRTGAGLQGTPPDEMVLAVIRDTHTGGTGTS